MKALRARAADDRGFSLAEMLVVMVVGAIVLTATSSMMISTLRAERGSSALRESMDSARVASERLRRELRGAQRLYPVNSAGVAAGPLVLPFWIDRNANGAVEADEEVTYELVEEAGEGQLRRYTRADPVPRIIARGLDLSVVSGLSQSRFTWTVPPPDTRVIDVVLVVRGDAAGATSELKVEESMRVRNVR